jgi:hypothetical protein
MTASARNIIVGAAQVWLSKNVISDVDNPLGSAPAPTFVANTPAAETLDSSTDWVNVGYTSDGLEVSYEPDFGEVQVDQLLDAAKLFKQGMKVNLKTSFAEATLRNLFIVMNQQTDTLSTSGDVTPPAVVVPNATGGIQLSGGQLGDAPVERSLIAVGPGPKNSSLSNAERIYYAARVLSIETSSHGLKRNEATMFPVTFRLLPVSTYSNSYGKIVDRAFTPA